MIRRALIIPICSFMCQFVFESYHRSCIVICISSLLHFGLQYVPMIFRSHRNTRPFRCRFCSSFGNIIVELPFIRSYLFFFPIPFVIIPFMNSTHFHCRVFFSFKFFELIIRLRNILFNSILLFLNAFLSHALLC